MAEINKLTDKIIDEAKVKADKILKDADEKVSKIEKNAKVVAEQEYNSVIKKAENEAVIIKERIKSNAILNARDNELKAKQEILDKVFYQSLEDMKSISSDDYIEYIKNNFSFDKQAQLVVTKNMVDFVKSFFKDVNLSEDRFVNSGFIEIIGGIEKNFTFEIQLNQIKDEVQGELAKVIFQGR